MHDAYPSLLSLNGTATALGTRMLHLHEFRFSWRIGERNTDKQSDIQQLSSDVIDLTGNVDGTSNNHCCTLFQSGLVLCAVQEFFGCNTCSIPNNRFVCLNCARTCHRGHDVYGTVLALAMVLVTVASSFPVNPSVTRSVELNRSPN
jgi:hypothetical protein